MSRVLRRVRLSVVLAFALAAVCLQGIASLEARCLTFCVQEQQEGKNKSQADNKKQDKSQADKKKQDNKKKPVRVRAVPLAVPLPIQYTKAMFIGAKKFVVDQQFATHIELLDRICEIDEKQKRKLQIASKGQSSKFAELWIQKNEQQFSHMYDPQEKDTKEYDYRDVGEINPSILRMVQISMRKIYVGEKSPVDHDGWQKVLSKTLTPEQMVVYRNFEKAKATKFQKYQVTLALKLMDVQLDLSQKQLDKIKAAIEPILSRFKYPPSLFNYDAYIAMFSLLKVEDELQKILGPAQQKKWKTIASPYRFTLRNIETQLKALEDEEKEKK